MACQLDGELGGKTTLAPFPCCICHVSASIDAVAEPIIPVGFLQGHVVFRQRTSCRHSVYRRQAPPPFLFPSQPVGVEPPGPRGNTTE